MTTPVLPPWGEAHLPTLLAHCTRCGAYSFPSTAYGCRQCGASADELKASPMPQTPVLRNFVTVYGDVAPGLTPPFVVGEVELAPGLIEEALIAANDESQLQLGMPLEPVSADANDALRGLRFRPLAPTRSTTP